ncbi:phage tail sheath subtilisin-like domain-containing protein, partial [Lutimonas halocynthiae]
GPPTNTDDNKGVYAYDKAKHTLYGPKATADEWGDPLPLIQTVRNLDISDFTIEPKDHIYRLHSAMKFFYANGGGSCYVISVGGYPDDKNFTSSDAFIEKAIPLLTKEPEPTMLVIPDAVSFENDVAYGIQNAMIKHCGNMMSRVAILDIPGGFDESTDSVEDFRNIVSGVPPKYNSYAAAYYPWLHTSVYQQSDINYRNIDIDSYANVVKLIETELIALKENKVDDKLRPEIQKVLDLFDKKSNKEKLEQADATLKILSKQYSMLLSKIRKMLNLMPPSAAMAGIYTAVDNNIGVWKAPANVAVQSVIAPAINIDYNAQQDLNVPLNGKSVCAIRAFTGRGILVWGARTLDGNSNDWRYINVRRTLI